MSRTVAAVVALASPRRLQVATPHQVQLQLQPQLQVDTALVALGQVLAMVALAGGLGAGVGLVHRWYARRRVAVGLTVLVGLSGVAVVLNTTATLGTVIGGTPVPGRDPLSPATATVNVVTVLLSGVAAAGGGRAGDRLGEGVFALSGATRLEADVSAVVKAVGRVVTVTLPEEIEDMEGYDPVPEETKRRLAGQTLVFPRRLTVEELRERLVARLTDDYDVGHVDVDVTRDGTVEYLAAGSRQAGLGPTLPPGTAATAVRADPAFATGAGDLVALYRDGERVTTAEVRGTAGDVVTVATDAADAERLDPGTRYRLVTLPVESRADREFVTLLRAARETMGSVAVTEGGLAGRTVGSVEGIVAIRGPDGALTTIPPRDRVLAAGESAIVIAAPARIRELEALGGGSTPPSAGTDSD